jgi:hypothetical protein
LNNSRAIPNFKIIDQEMMTIRIPRLADVRCVSIILLTIFTEESLSLLPTSSLTYQSRNLNLFRSCPDSARQTFAVLKRVRKIIPVMPLKEAIHHPARYNVLARNCKGRVPADEESSESDSAAENYALLVPAESNGFDSASSAEIQDPAESQTVSLSHVIALVMFCSLSVVICYADRANIADAILPMSEEYGWGKGINGIVLSSFFVGYASTQACRTPTTPAIR